MNLEDLHNELNHFPEDLKYTEANWEAALDIIEAHEATVAKRKVIFGSLSGVAAVIAIFLFFGNNVEVMSAYSPRELNVAEEINELRTDDEIVSFETLVNRGDREDDTAVSITNKKELISPENKKSLEVIDENPIEEESEYPIYERTSNSSGITDVNPKKEIKESVREVNLEETLATYQTESAGEILNSENKKLTNLLFVDETEAVSENFIATNPKVLDDVSFTNLLMKPGMLRIKLPTRSLKNKKMIDGGKGFTIYKNFLALKIGVNPWADYGRSDLFNDYNPSVGLFYEGLISEDFSWSTGVEYYTMSGIDLSRSSSVTRYNYSVESLVTTVHTNKAHFVSLPVNVSFRPVPRLQLKSGLAVGALIETNNTLEERQVTAQASELISQADAKGYRTSFKTLNLAASFGVNYWFSQRNSLQVMYHKGLTDFSRNSDFNNEKKDFTSRIEISLNRVLR